MPFPATYIILPDVIIFLICNVLILIIVEYMSQGKLVPDELIINLVVKRLQEKDVQEKGMTLHLSVTEDNIRLDVGRISSNKEPSG